MSNKRVTSFDVAERAGVSRSVVSAVLNGTPGIGVSPEKRQAVLKAMRELNYHVDAQARGMKTGKSFCIAAYGDTSNPLFLQLLEGLQQAAANNGYHVLLLAQGVRHKTHEGMAELYLQRRIDGIISLDATSYCDTEWAALINRLGIPFVSVEGYGEYPGVVSVLADYRESIHTALRYIDGTRGSVPVYIQIYDELTKNNWSERQRSEAYAAYCRARNVEASVAAFEKGDMEAVIAYVRQRRKDGLPLLFLVNWAEGAFTMYKAAARLGLTVGQDLWVMSGDDTYRANRYLVPGLAAMEIPYTSMGIRAVELLMDQLERPHVPVQQEKYSLPAKLVPGESC